MPLVPVQLPARQGNLATVGQGSAGLLGYGQCLAAARSVAQARFLQQTGDPAAAQQLAWQALENLRHQQASALAYFDCFWLFAVVMLAVMVVVFLMKRSVAEKGVRVGGE